MWCDFLTSHLLRRENREKRIRCGAMSLREYKATIAVAT
jgi:hypothetical protein